MNATKGDQFANLISKRDELRRELSDGWDRIGSTWYADRERELVTVERQANRLGAIAAGYGA